MLTKKFSKREYEQRAKEIVARMKKEATAFADNSGSAKRERIRRARSDRFYFFKTYLPHYFTKPPAEFHRELLQYADIKNEPVFLAAPRKHAKSTIYSLGVPLHNIAFELKKFGIIISDTETLAADFNQFIQIEIEENERFRQDFGDLVNRGDWAAEDFRTKSGMRHLARGRNQRIRGFRNGPYPPDWVDVDDLENDLNVRNPRLIKETINWLLTAVLCSLADNYTFMMIGTILTRKSVLSQMMMMKSESTPDKTRFMSKIYKAITEFGVPLWPEEWPMERLMKLKEQIGSVRFNQEMMNDPKDDEGLFREEWIRYYHPEELVGKALRVYTAIDPSMESGSSNDFKAIVTLGIDTDGIYYVLDAFIRHCSVDTMARVSYSRYEELHPLVISMEENALGEFAQSPFVLVAKDKKYQLPIKGIKHTIAKEARVGRLSPYVERGMIRFQKGHSDQDLLVEQLIYFPSTTVNDDGPDALEGAVDLAEKGSGIIEFQSTGAKRVTMGREMARYVG